MHGTIENLKARILKSVITWSEMGQQTAQAKEDYRGLTSLCKFSLSVNFKKLKN